MANDRATEALVEAVSKLIERLERLESRAIASPAPVVTGKSPDELHASMMEDIRGSTDDVERIGLSETIVGVKSDLGAADSEGNLHGATFDAVVNWQPVHKGGKLVGRTSKCKVTTLANYAWPAGIDVHLSAGGLVPDGMEMLVANDKTRETDQYKQWKYETFYKADCQRFVGRPLPAHLRAQPTQPTQAASITGSGLLTGAGQTFTAIGT